MQTVPTAGRGDPTRPFSFSPYLTPWRPALRGDAGRPALTPQKALETVAGRLAYQTPQRMWRGVRENVEVRLGRLNASDFKLGFGGRGSIRTEPVRIVETMSVSPVCEPGAFRILARSKEGQLVKPDIVKGTALHQGDFGKWTWLVSLSGAVSTRCL